VLGAVGLLCCQLFANGGSALLYAGPGVTVNGFPAVAQEVLPGDKLRIPAKSVVHLKNGTDSVTVGSESEAEYDAQSITLIAGTATVETKTGVVTRVRHFTISPTSAETKYEVTWHDLKGQATVLEGSINVTGGTKDVAAVKGQTVILDERHDKPLAYLQTGRIPKAVYYAAGGGGAAAILGLVAGRSGSKCNAANPSSSPDGSCGSSTGSH